MGAGLIAVAIILVVIVFFYSQVSEAYDAFFEKLNEGSTAGKLKPTAAPGQEVCDLKIIVRGDIDHVLFSIPTILSWNFGEESTLFGLWTIDHGAFESSWLSCNTPNTLSFFNMIPVPQIEKLTEPFDKIEPIINTDAKLQSFSIANPEFSKLTLIAFGSSSYAMEISLHAGDKFLDKNNKSGMTKTVLIGAGIIPEPIGFEKTFLIENIPRQDYELKVVIVDQKINDMPSNNPYVTNISK